MVSRNKTAVIPIGKEDAFVTQPQKPFSQVVALFSRLNMEIQKVDSIIQERIGQKQDKFLTAYRRQMAKIKQDMYTIRNSQSTKVHQETVKRLKVINTKLKQEALDIFIRLEEKAKELDQTRIALQYQREANEHLQREVKRLMKTIKTTNTNSLFNQTIKEEVIQTDPPEDVLQHSRFRLDYKTHTTSRRPGISQQIMRLVKPEESARQVIQLVHDWQKRQGQLMSNTKKMFQRKYTSNDLSQKSQFQKLFMECVQSVRKKLQKSNPLRAATEYQTSPLNPQQFGPSDKDQILRMFLEGKDTFTKLYSVVFQNKPTFRSRSMHS